MSLKTPSGAKVKVTSQTANNGYDPDKKQVREMLEIGKEYTVKDMMVGRSESSVRLEELPEARFNTVMFVNASEFSEAESFDWFRKSMFGYYGPRFKTKDTQ